MVIDYTKGRYPDYDPQIQTEPDMPTGPYNRVADNSLAKKLLGWEPGTNFAEGLRKTMDWYFSTKDPNEVRAIFGHMLTGRGAAPEASAMAEVGSGPAGT
jgi:dTDP-D-glucose 4,6-dehydratase